MNVSIPLDVILYTKSFVMFCPFCKDPIFSNKRCKVCKYSCCKEKCIKTELNHCFKYDICRWCYTSMLSEIKEKSIK